MVWYESTPLKYAQVVANSSITYHIMLIIAQISFALFYLVSKYALQFFHTIHFTLLRNVVCTLSMVPLWLLLDRKFEFTYRKEAFDRDNVRGLKRFFIGKLPNWRDNLLLMLSGLLVIPFNQIAFIFGLFYTDAVVAGIFQPANVVFTALISILLRNEEKSLLKFFGITLSVIGAISMILVTGVKGNAGDTTKPEEGTFTVLGFNLSTDAIIGSIFFIVNTISYSAFLNLQRVLLNRKIPPFTVSTWSFFYGTVFCGVITLFFVNSMDYMKTTLIGWLCILFAGVIGGALPFLITTVSSGRLSPLVVSTYSTTIPIFSTIFSIIFLGQFISYWSIIPCALIISGVLIVAYAKYQESKKNEAKEDAKPETESSNMEMNNTEVVFISPLAETECDDEIELISAGPSRTVSQDEDLSKTEENLV